MVWFLRARKRRRLAALEEFRQARKLIDEDVTVFGEQLSDLHVETLTTELDRDMRADYQRALDLYEEAKSALRGAEAAPAVVAAVVAIAETLDEGRFRLACVLAARDGVELPTRRDPCFFNPQHGPAAADVAWTPPGGVERKVPVCRSDANRLAQGDQPDIRLVRVGDRYVPWYAAERERGLLTAAIGTEAVAGVPRYVMLQADLNRASNNQPGGFGRR
jgi:ketosteroid isomerase-like protein